VLLEQLLARGLVANSLVIKTTKTIEKQDTKIQAHTQEAKIALISQERVQDLLKEADFLVVEAKAQEALVVDFLVVNYG